MSGNGLTLYTIEQTILDLISLRADSHDPEELAVIDQQIADWVKKEIRKVDGVHSYARFVESQIATADCEIKRLTRAKQHWENTLDRLKDVCLRVMELIEAKRLNGTAGRYLLVKGNGGRLPLTITDESLVPDELCDVTVSMPAKLWNRVEFEVGPEYLAPARVVRTPNGDRIREALQAGEAVGGARLGERGTHLEIR